MDILTGGNPVCLRGVSRKGHVYQPSAIKDMKILCYSREGLRMIKQAFLNPAMCLSEHPFGTIKRSMVADYFLLKEMRKVRGEEFALFCLGYNLIRAKNLLGFDKMMELMAG